MPDRPESLYNIPVDIAIRQASLSMICAASLGIKGIINAF